MGTYNLHYTTGMAQSQHVYFYENITSAIDTNLLSGQNLIFYIRGRKTNWVRTIGAYPTDSGNFAIPTYLNNSRYWTLRFTNQYPSTSAISTYDGVSNASRKTGIFVSPINETYDITLYYGSYTLSRTSLTKIEGINIVLNVTVDKSFGFIETDNPISYYTEYSDNDLIEAIPNDTGRADGGLNERDAQYGTQTWNN